MLAKLLILFVAVPLLELILLLRIGSLVGFWPTVTLVVATGAVGAILARGQGLLVVQTIRSDVAAGRMPTSSLMDGMLILVGGAVLMTPGVLTDVLGILLLFSPTRALFKARLRRSIERRIATGQAQVITFRTGARWVDDDPEGPRR